MTKKKEILDVVHATQETHTLPCIITGKERAEAADQLATAIQQGESLELERKSTMGDLKKRKDNLLERIHNLTIKVKDSIEMRPVVCELRLNHTKLTATLIRLDTNEEVESRPLTEDEKQMNLDDF